MPTEKTILVAGDVCLDVVGVPIPKKAADQNWRQTGEMRTHFLPGGAMLLTEFIRAAIKSTALVEAEKEIKDKDHGTKAAEECRKTKIAEANSETRVCGPLPALPPQLESLTPPTSTKDFIDNFAARLTRKEIVHSLFSLGKFKPSGKKNEELDTLRVATVHGYSGPEKDEPSLKFTYAAPTPAPAIIVLDDTGNTFRTDSVTKRNPWPETITKPTPTGTDAPLIVYKLHQPLPSSPKAPPAAGAPLPTSGPPSPAGGTPPKQLWETVASNHPQNRLIIISVNDLREVGLPISKGLSWERTALDVVWHLRNDPKLAELKKSPRLVVRLGRSGAIYWQHRSSTVNDGKTDWAKKPYQAWLIYDPQAIEGTISSRYHHLGGMVGTGSVFTAAIVHKLAESDLTPLRIEATDLEPVIVEGIRAGLTAARRLLDIGFGKNSEPEYPDAKLFMPLKEDDDNNRFPCRCIPIIPEALQADRGYWRLLDDIFAEHGDALRAAVTQTARGWKPAKKDRILPDAPAPAPNPAQDKDTERELRAAYLLSQSPLAVFAKALSTYDRREMEHYRALYSLLHDYVRLREPERPLSVAVFGPPGAGKGFGVKKVAEAIGENHLPRPIAELTFNLSQYQTPEELATAFHLVRDRVLEGKIPLVFFDEFDTPLRDRKLAWLQYFLAPMQDGKFLDRGEVHPIGQAIFVFAGGTCDTFQQFAAHPGMPEAEFKAAKGPDFLSRLRGALDIPSLNFLVAREPRKVVGQPEAIVDSGTFDPYAPVDTFPSRAAILLRRAGVLAYQLGKKAPSLKDGDGVLNVRPEVLRALLHLPQFAHGNRSFEAMLDMSQLVDAQQFAPAFLPPKVNTVLHANPAHLDQLVGTDYPFPDEKLVEIAKSVHATYCKDDRKITIAELRNETTINTEWDNISPLFRNSNLEFAREIPDKLRSEGLWFRAATPKTNPDYPLPADQKEMAIERLAIAEHDRWVADQRRCGQIWAEVRNKKLLHHHYLRPWWDLDESTRKIDRDFIRAIPVIMAAAGYEIIHLSPDLR